VDKEEFIKLRMADKVEFLWNEGEIISEKVYYDCNITLFLFENFFIEVFFNRVENEIASIEVQDDERILYDYVKNLDLNELVKLLH
jgi:hypothetical protein